MSTELKIKYKTLAAEARFIRLEKRKAKAQRRYALANSLPAKAQRQGDLAQSLHLHKLTKVRPAARSTHLAQCFLRGTPYHAAEMKLNPSTPYPDWDAIEAMVKRYGPGDRRDLMQKFSEWTETAKEA